MHARQPDTPDRRTTIYRPEIDGLRTVAVTAVIIFHLNHAWLKGGFLGVDVFFVLSGFLISSIIAPQIMRGEFSLLEFWKRRIRRLYPALLAMVAIVLLLGSFLLIRPERSQLPMQALASIFSFQNMYLMETTGGYWSLASDDISLLHTWSLSLEEQFYVVFPLLLLGIKKLGRGSLRSLLTVAFGLSLASCLYITAIDPTKAFYLLPTRMWELLAGSLLALGASPGGAAARRLRGAGWLQGLGLGLIILSFFTISSSANFPGILPALPCFGTLLILRYGSEPGPIKAVLASRPFVYLGKISYSLYLWHWPVIVFSKYLSTTFNAGLVTAISLGLAMLSYHLIENPFRRGVARPRLAIAVVAGGLAVCFAPLLFIKTSPLFSNLGNIDSKASLSRGWEFEATELIKKGEAGVARMAGKDAVDLCIVGSSHARVLCAPLARFSAAGGYSCVSMATSAVEVTDFKPSKLRPDADKINAARLQGLGTLKPEVTVVAGKWSGNFREPDFIQRTKSTLALLHGQSGQVIVLGQVPLVELPEGYEKSFRKYLTASSLGGTSAEIRPSPEVLLANRVVEDCVRELALPNLHFLNPHDLFIGGDGQVVVVSKDRRFLYSDHHHVNDDGASLIFEALLREPLDRWLRPPQPQYPRP